jgi:hypothetical protein
MLEKAASGRHKVHFLQSLWWGTPPLCEDILSPIRTDKMSSRRPVGGIGGTREEGVHAIPVI